MKHKTEEKIYRIFIDSLNAIESELKCGPARSTDGTIPMRTLIPIPIAENAKYSYRIVFDNS